MQTTTRTIVEALIVTALVAGAAWGVMHVMGKSRRDDLLEEHETVVVARQRDWARERVQREMAAHEAARERVHRHEQELTKAMGGPVEALAKNPELGIGESIERIARACAPGGVRVQVRVERFTEFIAMVELSAQLDARTLASLARCVLTHSAVYVHRLQFSHRSQLLGELDRQAIESVPDWKNVSLAEVQRLMSSGETPGDAAAEANVSSNAGNRPAVEEEQNLTPEARLQRQAADVFQASMDAAHQSLRNALEHARRAMDMTGAQTSAGLQSKKALLDQAGEQVSQARAVLEDPASEYRRALERARLDEVYVRSATRTMALRHDPMRPAAAEMFNKFFADLRSSASLIDALTQHFRDWTYDSVRRRFEFESQFAHRDIKAALDASELSGRELSEAMSRWSKGVEELNKAAAGRGR